MTIRELKTNLGSIRLWLDEFPAALISDGIVEEANFRTNQMLPTFSKVACEMETYTGKFNYALLGCEVGPLSQSRTTVRLFETDYRGPVYSTGMVQKYETVRVGLPAEFIPGVLKGLTFAEPLVSASLDFKCAAHGEISSNQIMFSAVANALMKVLEHTQDEVDNDLLAGLISGNLFSDLHKFQG